MSAVKSRPAELQSGAQNDHYHCTRSLCRQCVVSTIILIIVATLPLTQIIVTAFILPNVATFPFVSVRNIIPVSPTVAHLYSLRSNLTR